MRAMLFALMFIVLPWCVAGNDTLHPGDTLASGQALHSSGGKARLEMAADGNLVLHDSSGKAVWKSHTGGHPGAHLRFQKSDDNLVVYAGSASAVWSSGPVKGAAKAQLQDDCNFVISDAKGVSLWSLGTKCSITPGPSPVPPPSPPSPMGDAVEFFALGDFGFGNSHQKQVASVMKSLATKNGLDYIVAAGDNIYNTGPTSASDHQWESKWSDIYAGPCMSVPWYAVLGNHDWESSDHRAELKKSEVSNTWNLHDFFYTRQHTVGNATVAWVHIETNLIFYGPQGENHAIRNNFEKEGWTSSADVNKHLARVEALLKQVQGATWIFVVGHMMNLGYVCGHVGQMGALVPLFEKYGVDAYFGGHTHALGFSKDSHGISYFLTGGGGQSAGMCGGGKKNWSAKSMGVLRGSLTASGFRAQYYDQDGKMMFEHSQGPRKGTVGESALSTKSAVIGCPGSMSDDCHERCASSFPTFNGTYNSCVDDCAVHCAAYAADMIRTLE